MKRTYSLKLHVLEEKDMTRSTEKGKGDIFRSAATTIFAVFLVICIFSLPVGAEGRGRVFNSPEDGVKALIDSLEADDVKDALAILGPEGKEIILSGDEVADKAARERLVAAYREMHRLEKAENGESVVLSVGQNDWPFPIPLVKEGDTWVFDTHAGKEELINRMIGRNEFEAMDLCKVYVNAQRDYARKDWDNDGVLEYAQKFVSDTGKWNGLYWQAAEDEIKSPLGPLYAEAAQEGYSLRKSGGKVQPFHGYYFRILKAQGKNAAGGAYQYVINGHMVAGFAMIAYPAQYGSSGIMTFTVSQDGRIYQKDLGPKTGAIALRIKAFDPDKTWTRDGTVDW
jgi:hypothetical protein